MDLQPQLEGVLEPIAPRRRGPVRAAIATALLLLAAGVVLLSLAPQAQAAPCDPPPIGNPVACENTKPGNPASEWDVSGAGSDSIQGFATDISVNRGEMVRFKVDTNASAYRLDIYRMGYYGGDGARRITPVGGVPGPAQRQTQPNCITQSATGLIDCGNWAVSASWQVPTDAVSGIYFAKLVRTDGTAGSSHVFFIVRDDASHSDLLFQTSDTTWQAYNEYGGNSLYTGSPDGRAYKVSYNRPITTRGTGAEDWVFNAEYPMVRFLERNGYNVSYTTGVDSDRSGAELLEHKAFLSVGHDEYWSGAQRANVEAARTAGVHLAFFSGNEVFWKTRWEKSIDGSDTNHRTLVSYKETHANAKIDPEPAWTGTWRDPRFSPPADGGRPENALTGQLFMVNDGATAAIRVPAADGKMRFWRNTSIATQSAGQTAALPTGTLGYEWDEDVDNGARPAGAFQLSSATYSGAPVLVDYGSNFGSGTATHNMTLYRAPSGALVFGAGTIQWSWGLDANHDRGSAAADPRMQQATVNLFADMGNVQPGTLQSGLSAATASSDAAAPTSTITSPNNGASVPANSTVTVAGTASDAGGGVVGGVEVSVDNGTTWHRASGRASWTYSFRSGGSGSATIKSRASDDSGNLETPSAGVTVTIGSGSQTCPCSIWGDAASPGNANEADSSAVELGVKFRAEKNGFITGVRFYKSSQNTGIHVGNLWTAAGVNLARANFANETASGWQRVDFSNPVPVTANTTYVASYSAPNGHYAEDEGFFDSSGVDSPPLHAPSSTAAGGNGVYGSPGSFPTDVFNNSNYWVDVVYTTSTAPDTTPPTVTDVSPGSGAIGVSPGANVTATFSEAMDAATITGNTVELRDPANNGVPAAVSYNATSRTATLNPDAALDPSKTYTATVKGGASGVKDVAGNALSTDRTWSFTTAAQQPGDTTPPTVTDVSPGSGATGVSPSANVTATFSEAMDPTTITGNVELRDPANNVVPAAVSYNATSRTATLNPDAALDPSKTYTATVKGGASGVKDVAGNALSTDRTWSFTTAAQSSCPCSLWPSSATPQQAADSDTAAVQLGVKFHSSDVAGGQITGVRFYKSSQNRGTHVGSLWSATGTRLASATFQNETASGWQQVNFATPVPIQANTTYVAAYHAPRGRYAADEGFFSNGVDSPPLHAPSSVAAGGNGVYAYSSSATTFPASTYGATNYWVDVVFTT